MITASRAVALLALAAAASVGCGALEVDHSKVVDPPPGAAEAIQAVATSYGMRSLPTVYWYGNGLTCDDGKGYIDQLGDCVSGNELNGVITLALPPGLLINEFRDEYDCAMLTHEMGHAASEQAGEGGCGNHDCHWFQGRCQAATAILAAMML